MVVEAVEVVCEDADGATVICALELDEFVTGATVVLS